MSNFCNDLLIGVHVYLYSARRWRNNSEFYLIIEVKINSKYFTHICLEQYIWIIEKIENILNYIQSNDGVPRLTNDRFLW